MVFGDKAYKAVVSNGLVLDKDGNKMSKRLGNAVNPFEAIEKFGSDPLRWYMIANSSPWDNLKFDEAGVQEVARKLFATLYNTYSFFALYANVDNFDPEAPQVPVKDRPEIDRWILSLLNSLIAEVDADLNDYEPTKAARAINDFVCDNLSNWYVRLNRKRFWGGEMNEDKLSAFQTLYTCLRTVALLIAPVAPFYADRLFADLNPGAPSVHLAHFPEADTSLIDKELEERMHLAQTVTSMVLALRRKAAIKVRQPLQAIIVPALNDEMARDLEKIKSLLLSEVNVKELRIVDATGDGMLVKKVKPDFKKLGPKFGKTMKQVAAAVQAMSQQQIADLEKDGVVTLDAAGTPAVIEKADVEIISQDIPGWLVANEGTVTVALDVTITDELKAEGIARDIVNRIQNIRKSRGFDITDRITLVFEPNTETDKAISSYSDYIARQVLADAITVAPVENLDGTEALDLDGVIVNVSVNKA